MRANGKTNRKSLDRLFVVEYLASNCRKQSRNISDVRASETLWTAAYRLICRTPSLYSSRSTIIASPSDRVKLKSRVITNYIPIYILEQQAALSPAAVTISLALTRVTFYTRFLHAPYFFSSLFNVRVICTFCT